MPSPVGQRVRGGPVYLIYKFENRIAKGKLAV